MTSSADFHLSVSEGLEFASAAANVAGLADELVFIQNRAGRFLSFEWRKAQEYGIASEKAVVDQEEVFAPLLATAYLDRIRQVLNSSSPERFKCPFHCAGQDILLDLVMSPVLMPDQAPNLVTVVGKLLRATPEEIAACRNRGVISSYPLASSSDRYQKLLTQISWNIRRTLDLPTIWQQTVKGLGKSLSVSRCIVCPYESLAPKVKVAAEYCLQAFPSLAGKEFWLVEDLYLRQAIASLKPIVGQSVQIFQAEESLVHCSVDDSVREDLAVSALPASEPASVLILATCYQDQPNGLILLYQCDRIREWSEAEQELMQELADQVGTAIAHATLFNASESLAEELQRANSSLMQKHRELEEARRQAEEASRLKSEFLANTSHELRTPLNGMLGFLKLIMDGMADDPVEQEEFINEAYRSALHLLNIINDVLDIAKIEAGKLQIELSQVKLNELLDDVEDFTGSQIHQKQLSFKIQKPLTDDEIILYGNYQRLLQVMLNLVGNAIKFTHEGGITIGVEIIKKKVTVQNQELPGLAIVRVEDTGIGVSLDKQDKLFQSFSQVDGSRTRQYGGTGLGLAISQKLVEAMGGEVNFYSLGEGLGSTVTFTVPLFQEPIMITSQTTSQATR